MYCSPYRTRSIFLFYFIPILFLLLIWNSNYYLIGLNRLLVSGLWIKAMFGPAKHGFTIFSILIENAPCYITDYI
jgi:hypothetical protein